MDQERQTYYLFKIFISILKLTVPLPKNFYDDVYKIVKKIPSGRVTSYGAIAEVLGAKGASRTVGYAMNKSHGSPSIPAHRVVNRAGLLTGKHHFGSINEMESLLNKEGIRVINNKIQNFQEIFWNPIIELQKDIETSEIEFPE